MRRLTGFAIALNLVVGCSRQSAEPAFNLAGAPTVQFSVPDMMCPEGCGAKVTEILSKQPGAKDVLVEFDSKTATVAIDRDKFDAQKAVAALVDCQFKNSTLKDANTAKPQAAEAKSVQ